MKKIIIFSILVFAGPNSFSQNWEEGLGITYFKITGTDIETLARPASDPYHTYKVNHDLIFASLKFGFYFPLARFGADQSFGLHTGAAFGVTFVSSTQDENYMFDVPIHIAYRYGAGGRKESDTFFGFGVSFGAELVGMAVDMTFENTSGRGFLYVNPNMILDVCIAPWENSAFKLQFLPPIKTYQFDRRNSEYSVNYGLDIKHLGIGVAYNQSF